jgi:hypothetical protein
MGLPQFLQGYTSCALWSSTNGEGVPLDEHYTTRDLSPEVLHRFEEDCKAFYTASIVGTNLPISDALAGYCFWLNRNGHGTGFWDRDMGDIGEGLSRQSQSYGPCDLYVGDDGHIYCA